MATSSKVQFRLETLKEEALRSVDERLAAKRAELESVGDEDRLVEDRKVWRARQEARISELFSKLGQEGELSDHQIAEFKVEPLPELDRWDAGRIRRELRELEATRTQIVAKGSSLVADEEGNISLTSRQLEEFFGL